MATNVMRDLRLHPLKNKKKAKVTCRVAGKEQKVLNVNYAVISYPSGVRGQKYGLAFARSAEVNVGLLG
jgi:hypothetical protein